MECILTMLNEEHFIPKLIEQLNIFHYNDVCFDSLLDLISESQKEGLREKAIEIIELYFGIKEGFIDPFYISCDEQKTFKI